jgi:hypothetical protein
MSKSEEKRRRAASPYSREREERMMQALQTTCDEGHEGAPQTSAADAAPTSEATKQQQEAGTPPAAAVPHEEEVLEGEVTAILEPEHQPTPKQPPYYLIVVVTIAGCLLFTLVSFLLPLFTPTATITLLPVERSITTLTAVQVHGRQVPPLTLAQSATVPATGKRHQDATRATGTITFYNGLLSRQTIAAGTLLTGADGVQMITDQAASIPPASNTTPPMFGQVTVGAHTVQPGTKSNIPPYDLNGSCCGASILVKNTTAFTGGQDARDYTVVSGGDMANAATALRTTLLKSEQAALHAQLTEREALITPPCTQVTTADHRIGEEAKEATITLSETCTGIAYDAHQVDADATQWLTSWVTRKLGATYTPFREVQVNIIQASMLHPRQGVAGMVVQATGTWAYQITPPMQNHLLLLVAGMKTQQAKATLLTLPGIAGVQITVKGGNQTLPQDPKAIRILVLYKAI